MTMKARVTQEELDKLADALKAEYKKGDDGSYQLDVEPVGGVTLADVTKLQTALQSERTELKKVKAAMKAFDGLEPEKAREALDFWTKFQEGEIPDEAKARIETFKKQVTEQADNRVKQVESKLKGELETTMKALQRTKAQFFETAVTSAAQRAIAAHKGSEPLLLPVVRNGVRMVEGEDGKLVIEVLGKDGQPRLSPKGGTTDLMSIDELVAEFKTDNQYARAFDGVSSSGSGAQSGSRRSATGAFTISEADARDTGRYRAARAEAEKAGQQLQIISAGA